VILASLDEGHLNVSARIIMSSQPDMEMVAQAGNAEQAIAEFRLTQMDLSLPGTNGTDTLIAIRAEFPNAQIIMLTMSEGDGEIQRAMRAGAAAYLLKSMTNDQLVAAIRAVHAGRKHVPTEIAARLAEHLGDENLTTRELDVLWLIRDGRRTSRSPTISGLPKTTANFYIKNLRSGPSPTSSTMRQGAGRNSVSQAHLLQPAPEGRPLRRPGAAEVPQRRDSRGLQIVDNHGLFRRRRGSPARRCETTRGEVGC
jgi:DNA-binding NarL/FixJ family response regulator